MPDQHDKPQQPDKAHDKDKPIPGHEINLELPDDLKLSAEPEPKRHGDILDVIMEEDLVVEEPAEVKPVEDIVEVQSIPGVEEVAEVPEVKVESAEPVVEIAGEPTYVAETAPEARAEVSPVRPVDDALDVIDDAADVVVLPSDTAKIELVGDVTEVVDAPHAGEPAPGTSPRVRVPTMLQSGEQETAPTGLGHAAPPGVPQSVQDVIEEMGKAADVPQTVEPAKQETPAVAAEQPASPPEEIFEVMDVVEEASLDEAPPAAPKAPEPVDEILDVVEEIEEAPGPKKTQIASRGGVSTMLAARDDEHQLGAELGGAAALHTTAPEQHAPAAQHQVPPAQDGGADVIEEILEAEGASDSGRKPAPAETPVEDDILDVVDLVEDPASSGKRKNAPLVDEQPEAPAKKPTMTADADKTQAFVRNPEEAGMVAPPNGAEPMDVVVEYEEENVLVEGASEVDVGKRPGSKPDRPSGVDIIAEALESGVDLGSAKSHTPQEGGKRPASESDIGFQHLLDDSAESSAVDLGSSGQRPIYTESPPPQEAKKRGEAEELVSADDALEAVDESALVESDESTFDDADDHVIPPQKKTRQHKVPEDQVDFEDEELVAPKGRQPAGPVEEDEDVLVQPKARAPVREEEDELLVQPSRRLAEEEEEATVAPTTKRKTRVEPEEKEALATPRGKGRRTYEEGDGEDRPKRRGRFLPFMTGAILALLLLVGGAAAVWYFQPELLDNIPASPNAVAKKPGTGGAPIKVAAKVPDELQPVFDEYKGLVEKNKVIDPEAQGSKEFLKKTENVGGKELSDTFKALFAEKQKVATLTDEQQKSKDALKIADEEKHKLGDELTVLGTAKKKTDDKLAEAVKSKKAVDAELTKAMEELEDRMKLLADVNDALKKAGSKETGAKGVQDLASTRDMLNSAVANAVKELKDGNYLVEDPDVNKQLVQSIRKARVAAQSPLGSALNNMIGAAGGIGFAPGDFFKKAFDTAKLERELKVARAQQAFAERPEKRLDTMLILLQNHDLKDEAALEGYQRFAKWVLQPESNASPAAKAKALFVEALVLRNKDDFDAARKELENTLTAAKALKEEPLLHKAAAHALNELTDPRAYYLPLIENYYVAGNSKAALHELHNALKVMPGNPLLHLTRAQVTLGSSLAAGKIDPETQKKIREDALEARKEKSLEAESFYLVGRLDEANREWAAAEKNYRKAIEHSEGAAGERYRVALGRVLLRDRVPGGDGAAEGDKGGGNEESEMPSGIEDKDEGFVFTATAGDQPPDDEDPAMAERLKETIRIAHELIKSNNPRTQGEGYMLLGAAQSRLGKRNEGLLHYAKGLELAYPGLATEELVKMINSHPAFQRSDVARQMNPVMSERYFAKGLEFFWSKNYKDAEGEFDKAVSFFDQDARYYYFLAMSRWLQKTKAKQVQAEYDFDQGVRLEIARSPAPYVINASLERIQGDLRRTLNAYREKALAPN